MPRPERPLIGYVLKMYPRLSETFVVAEILAREAAGAQIEIFSLRPPRDPRFHETLGAVRAPVTWLAHGGRRAAELWELLRGAAAQLPGLPSALGELVSADAQDGAQALELALLARERGLDHLHAHFGSAAATVARLAGRLVGIPYSFTAHAKDVFHDDVVVADMERKLADAHHVVTISEYNRRFLQDRYGAAADRVHLVRNGLTLEAFPFADPAARPPVVVAVGRLVEKKGFDVLLDACARLVHAGRRVRCELVGDGPLAGELRAQAARLGLSDHDVRFHGALSQREVRELVGKAAVLAAPCVVAADGNRDGLPTVLLEAMALGTPCVSTPVTGIPEAVRDGATGLLVPERDAAALAAALGRLVDDGALRVRLAGAARALVEQDFDADRQGRALDALVAGDAAPRARPRRRPRGAGPAPRRRGRVMRVAYVCADPGVPVWGAKGASVHVQEVVRELRRRGAAVELLCARTGGEPPADLADVPVQRLPAAPADDLVARERTCMEADRAVARALDALGPLDLVYERYSLFGRAGMAHAARHGVPGVLELNAPLIDEQARHRGLAHRHAAEAVVHGALDDATVAVAVSAPVAAWARERTRTPERIHVVANGVDVQRIRPLRRERDGAFRVGFVGTLKPWHGTETLADAFARLAAHAGDGWELLLVGDGPQAEALRGRARRLLIADRVELTGSLAPSAVPAQLARMDVAVAPYPSDDGGYCSPLKLFEYLAAGLPIVASRTSAVVDVLRHGDNALLVAPDDPAALAAALAALRADPDRRAALARAARASALSGHTWQGTVERMLELAFAAVPAEEAA